MRPNPRDHFVDDEQDVVLAADVADLREVALRRQVDAARTDDGFAEERGDRVGADLLDQLEQALRVVPGDRGGVGHQLAVTLTVGGNSRQGGARHVHPVIGLLAADHDRLGRLAHLVPVAAGELGRRVHGIRTTGREEDLAARHRRDGRETIGQGRGGLGNEVAEVREMSHGPQLLRDGVRDLRTAVPHVGEPQPGRRVEVTVAAVVPDVGALAAGHHEGPFCSTAPMSANPCHSADAMLIPS